MKSKNKLIRAFMTLVAGSLNIFALAHADAPPGQMTAQQKSWVVLAKDADELREWAMLYCDMSTENQGPEVFRAYINDCVHYLKENATKSTNEAVRLNAALKLEWFERGQLCAAPKRHEDYLLCRLVSKAYRATGNEVPTVDGLVRALEHGDDDQKLNAAMVLEKLQFRDSKVQAALTRALGHQNRAVQDATRKALESLFDIKTPAATMPPH